MSGRVVPWTSWEEWAEVYALLLLSDSPTDNRRGVNRVAAWRSRGRVPLAVDVTASLVDTRLVDADGSASESLVRHCYSLSIVRLVNGVSDASQKGKYAASVAGLAAAAGLPRALVDVRHEATHNELPGAHMLRLAAGHAAAWLRSSYWEAQAAQLDSRRQGLAALLQEYAQLHEAAAAAAAASGAPGTGAAKAAAAAAAEGDGLSSKDSRKRRQAIVGELQEAVPQAVTHLLADALLDGGVLAPPCPRDAEASAAAAAAAGKGREGGGGQVGRVDGSSALAAACRHWPALAGMVAAGAVSRAAVLAAAEDAGGGGWAAAGEVGRRWAGAVGDDRAAAAEAFGRLAATILDQCNPAPAADAAAAPPGGEGGRKGKRARKDPNSTPSAAAAGPAAGGPGPIGGPALAGIVRLCLEAGAEGAVAPVAPALAAAGRALSRPPAAGDDVASRAAGLARLSAPGAAGLGGAGGLTGGPPSRKPRPQAAAVRAAEEEQRSLLSRLRQGGATGAGEGGEAGPWRLCEEWAPCGIGALPSPLNPSGAVPPLDLPTPPAPVPEEGAEAPAAARAHVPPAAAAASGAPPPPPPAAAAPAVVDPAGEGSDAGGAEGEGGGEEGGQAGVMLAGQAIPESLLDVATLRGLVVVL